MNLEAAASRAMHSTDPRRHKRVVNIVTAQLRLARQGTPPATAVQRAYVSHSVKRTRRRALARYTKLARRLRNALHLLPGRWV